MIDRLFGLKGRRIIAALGLAIYLVVLCFFRDREPNMYQNLLAELGGIVLGAVLTITVITEALDWQHRKHWEKVHDQVLRAILSDVWDIAWAYARRCYQLITRAIWFKGGEPPEDAVDDLKEMLEEMRKKGAGWWVQELFRDTEWRFYHLRDVLSPRLMDVGEEQKLIELLLRIDSRHTAWKDYLRMFEQDIRQLRLPFNESSLKSLSNFEEVPDALLCLGDSFRPAMDTLEALIEVYEYLVERMGR